MRSTKLTNINNHEESIRYVGINFRCSRRSVPQQRLDMPGIRAVLYYTVAKLHQGFDHGFFIQKWKKNKEEVCLFE